MQQRRQAGAAGGGKDAFGPPPPPFAAYELAQECEAPEIVNLETKIVIAHRVATSIWKKRRNIATASPNRASIKLADPVVRFAIEPCWMRF